LKKIGRVGGILLALFLHQRFRYILGMSITNLSLMWAIVMHKVAKSTDHNSNLAIFC